MNIGPRWNAGGIVTTGITYANEPNRGEYSMLYQYAVTYEYEAGELEIIVKPAWVATTCEASARIVAARAIPEDFADLEDFGRCTIHVRPF